MTYVGSCNVTCCWPGGLGKGHVNRALPGRLARRPGSDRRRLWRSTMTGCLAWLGSSAANTTRGSQAAKLRHAEPHRDLNSTAAVTMTAINDGARHSNLLENGQQMTHNLSNQGGHGVVASGG